MPFDDGSGAVDLSRAAKQWQALGEEKIVAGRNAGNPKELHRLSSLLDAIGPFRKAEELWLGAATSLRAAGDRNEKTAAVADQQAGTCSRQIDFCGETFHENVLQWAFDQHTARNQAYTRIAAYEFERHADNRPFEWLIPKFLDDPVLRRRESWGAELDLWWLAP